MARPSSGTGKGGKSFQDRQLAADVRTKALKDILSVLNDKKSIESWSDYKKQLVMKLAGSILPRINEHGGPGGEQIPLVVRFIDAAADNGHTG